MKDCIFCKIIAGEIPSGMVWEDAHHYAFLDVFPNCYGQTLVIPKKHHNSKLFEMSDSDYKELLVATKKVANKIEEKLQVERVGMIMEGMGVNHVHMKLYPMHGLTTDWEVEESGERLYFEKYPGYLTSKMGEILSQEKINTLLDILRK